MRDGLELESKPTGHLPTCPTWSLAVPHLGLLSDPKSAGWGARRAALTGTWASHRLKPEVHLVKCHKSQRKENKESIFLILEWRGGTENHKENDRLNNVDPRSLC